MVKDKGFKDFCDVFGYKPPGAKKLRKMFDVADIDHLKELNELLRDVQSLSLTTDGWTSDSKDQFIGLTMHFALKTETTLELRSCCIGVAVSEERHTAEMVAQEMEAILKDAGLIEKKISNFLSIDVHIHQASSFFFSFIIYTD